jgi:coenzyme Q-binding protein COQ10
MTTTWTFQKLSDAGADLEEEEDDGLGLPMSDGVVVDFEIDFEVNDPVHAAAVSVVFKDVAAAQISAFEKRVRSLALAAMR